MAEVEEYLKGLDYVTDITTTIGGTAARYNLVRSIAIPSLSYGELIVSFTTPKAIDENIVVVEDKKEGEDYKLVEVEKKEITLEEVIEKSDSFSETEKEKLRKDIGKMNDLEEQLTDIYEKINE